eukprot:NODE_4463_length_781_cov_24.492355_g4440_i0.p1 GENE.NODE_4463_length_781_cov_24.492355_g4440_i0~~NODE_4463_length_781_cov_24.492355_g4440_i0.p1  ORF type:complete len:206 (+),score=50.82 NODE_4463_length_781_cov_24.492355_g4440_i0:131-748(+)
MFHPAYDIRAFVSITADLLYRVFVRYGTVQKIVVITKQTTESRAQALVQFDSGVTAENAKNMLQGQSVFIGENIYFTLDIQYSNLGDLTVNRNTATAMVFSPESATSPPQQPAAQHPTAAADWSHQAASAQPNMAYPVPQQPHQSGAQQQQVANYSNFAAAAPPAEPAPQQQQAQWHAQPAQQPQWQQPSAQAAVSPQQPPQQPY